MSEPITHFNPPTSKNHLALGDLWTPTRPTVHIGWSYEHNAPIRIPEEPRLILGFFEEGNTKTNRVKVEYTRESKGNATCGARSLVEWIRATGATVKRARVPEAVP